MRSRSFLLHSLLWPLLKRTLENTPVCFLPTESWEVTFISHIVLVPVSSGWGYFVNTISPRSTFLIPAKTICQKSHPQFFLRHIFLSRLNYLYFRHVSFCEAYLMQYNKNHLFLNHKFAGHWSSSASLCRFTLWGSWGDYSMYPLFSSWDQQAIQGSYFLMTMEEVQVWLPSTPWKGMKGWERHADT